MAATSKTRGRGGLAAFALGVAVLVGCSSEPPTGEVSGTVTVDGEVPSEGSSINFLPTDGKSSTAGALIEKGKYAVRVPAGMTKVEIRIPRPLGKGKGKPAGPKAGPGAGPAAGGVIEESLPAEYNDKSTLTLDVKPGSQEKNWDVKAKK